MSLLNNLLIHVQFQFSGCDFKKKKIGLPVDWNAQNWGKSQGNPKKVKWRRQSPKNKSDFNHNWIFSANTQLIGSF